MLITYHKVLVAQFLVRASWILSPIGAGKGGYPIPFNPWILSLGSVSGSRFHPDAQWRPRTDRFVGDFC